MSWLVQLQCDGFCFIILYVVMFCCYSLEAWSFLLRERKVVYPDGRRGEEQLEGVEGWETVIRIYVWEDNLFSIRGWKRKILKCFMYEEFSFISAKWYIHVNEYI